MQFHLCPQDVLCLLDSLSELLGVIIREPSPALRPAFLTLLPRLATSIFPTLSKASASPVFCFFLFLIRVDWRPSFN